MNTIQRWQEVPKFSSRHEETDFWSNHGLSGRLMANSRHDADVKESTTITLRFDPRMLSKIKRLARSRYLNYQSMIKQWLAERMEVEADRSSNKDV
jgi:predicted DNA binding CopG/RHH family protein